MARHNHGVTVRSPAQASSRQPRPSSSPRRPIAADGLAYQHVVQDADHISGPDPRLSALLRARGARKLTRRVSLVPPSLDLRAGTFASWPRRGTARNNLLPTVTPQA